MKKLGDNMALLNEDYSGYSAEELEAKKRQILSLTAADVRDEFVAQANEMLEDVRIELRESLSKSIVAGFIFTICLLLSAVVIYNCYNSPFKFVIIIGLSLICIALLVIFIKTLEKLKFSKTRLNKSESEVCALKNTMLSEKDLIVFKMHCFEMIEASIIESSMKP